MSADPTEVRAWDATGQDQVANAVPIPRQSTDAQWPIPITARVVFESPDGTREEVFLETFAHGWTRTAVYVATYGPRTPFTHTWLRPSDVRRRSVAPPTE